MDSQWARPLSCTLQLRLCQAQYFIQELQTQWLVWSACSTAFTYDLSELTQINRFLTNQIKEASSTQEVSFTSVKVVYPDSSENAICDISSFTIDDFYVVGQTSFEATIRMSFRVNGVAKEENLTTIRVDLAAKTPPNCMSCMPNCSECSDIFVCNICSAGNLFEGVCITSTLSFYWISRYYSLLIWCLWVLFH